jgi:glycosyltransferase involved in cell wall biosynthesis
MKKVLIFLPQNPYPPHSGFHKRCLEVIDGFKELGCEVTLASSTLYTEQPWTAPGIQSIKGDGIKEVEIYEPGFLDRQFPRGLRRYYWLLKKSPPLGSRIDTPPGLRRWFARLVKRISPDLVVVNYAFWGTLVDGLEQRRRTRKPVVKVMETIDLLTLNLQMWHLLEKHLPPPPIDASVIDDQILEEDFFTRHHLTAHPEEYAIYDKYDYTIAITRQEAETIRQHTRRTRVLHIPMTQSPRYIDNRYDGVALLPTGPNPFNVQGYFYFVKRVLPLVRKRSPSFRLQVTGYCSDRVSPEENIILSGFVPDLEAVYESARFVVCPIFGGTGQQVKIVEAMARGVPVVALRAVSERSPIRHEINGLVADTAEEFAAHVCRLWDDPELCRRLGQEARKTIAAESSQSRVTEGLASMFDSRAT